MKKIVICYSIPTTFSFATETIASLKKEGYQVILISSHEQELINVAKSLNVDWFHLKISRDFTVIQDVITLIKMVLVFRKFKPLIVIGATPKAALLSMIASKISGVKHRIYHIFGLPFETANGLKRNVLLLVEKITSYCASSIIPISYSLKKEYEAKFRFFNYKIHSIGLLSIAGVDLEKFDVSRFVDRKDQIKKDLGIPNNYFVIGFVARLTIDKGVGDFIALWNELKKKYDKIAVVIIGERDSRDAFNQDLLNVFLEDQNVFNIKKTNEVEKYMSIMDVFVLPSFREGFGNVNIEASSMKVPVVSYNVTGCKDSVKDGFSGFLVKKNDIDALVEKVSYFLDSPLYGEKIGSQGRLYAEKHFSSDKVAAGFVNYLNSLK
jgi:glycosyltransferase involved in cell wall biosynthesis